jgi:hypothetical protein
MAFIVAPSPPRTEPFYKTHYICTNKKCLRKGAFVNHKKNRVCPKCYAHVEVTKVSLVVPKEMKCHYCGRSDCGHLLSLLEG